MTTTVRVGDISEQVRGVSYSKSDVRLKSETGFIPLLRGGNITDAGLVWSDLQFVPESIVSPKQMLRSGDIVIAASSGSLSSVGKSGSFESPRSATFGAFCKVLRPNGDVNQRYFANYFKTANYRNRISHLAAGANINNLRNEHLNDLVIPLPPLHEQRRIAAILDEADHLRTQRREALAHLDGLTRSIFQSAFGPENPASLTWPETRLDGLGRVVTGKTPPARLGAEASGTFRPFVTPGDLEQLAVKRGLSELGAEYAPAVNAGSLLVCCIGATIGKMGIAAQKSSFNQQINAVEWNGLIVPSYGFYAALQIKNTIRANSSSTTMPILNKSEFSKLTIPVPPLELQQTFAGRVAGVERLKDQHRTQLAELDTLFASLQNRAFRGEL